MLSTSNLLEIEEGKKSLLFGGKVHRGSPFSVANEDVCPGGAAKIGAQQIHVLEMRAGVRRVHIALLLIDPNGNPGWNWVGSKQFVACLESVISGYK